MFLSSCLLLVPMILATEIEVQNNYYVIKIENETLNTLRSIEVIGDSLEQLNLYDLSLNRIADFAFDNVGHIKILNLSNNSLRWLWENTFTNLMNLEQLYLPYNKIFSLRRPFAVLSNLKVLDLSNNLITHLRASDFYGLTKSCVIALRGDAIFGMSTELFKNRIRTLNNPEVDNTHHLSDKDMYSHESVIRIKICFNGTKLISAENYTEGEKLAIGCSTDTVYGGGVLFLGSLGIAEFQKGWYKLENSPINHIDLSSNKITRLTSEMLNDLPERISIVSLGRNNILRLEKGIIANEHLREIHFSYDSIIEIEDEVFINTNLTTLTLSHNYLADTKFIATLPPTLTKIELDYNKITEISRESFLKLNKLQDLVLSENYITEIHRDSLHGLLGLKKLHLMNNRMRKIEAGSFKDLTALEVLHLEFNYITKLEPGVLADLRNIKKIFLGWNRLSNLTRDSLINLPDSLEVLDLQSNALENLKAGTFLNSPKYELLLNNNYIRYIENGSFNLPHLQNLVLSYNFLSVIDNGKFRDLKNLQNLRLEFNKITRIEKGAFENLRNLCQLFISDNPIKRLENDTLLGLLQENGCYVELNKVPIEVIDGGVFGSSVNSYFDRLSNSNNSLLKVL